jgi:hypothetical protein
MHFIEPVEMDEGVHALRQNGARALAVDQEPVVLDGQLIEFGAAGLVEMEAVRDDKPVADRPARDEHAEPDDGPATDGAQHERVDGGGQHREPAADPRPGLEKGMIAA